MAVAGLQPPEDYAADHELVTGYVAASVDLLDVIIEASAGGDASAVLDAYEAWNDGYCETASALSEDIEPAASVYFDAGAPRCRG